METTSGGRDREQRKFRRGLTAALLECARQRFALDKPDPVTGKSQLQTFYDIRKQTGVVRRELRELKSIPPETRHLWEWYCALAARRGAGFSVNAISWSDMWAFFQLQRISPEKWEVDTICKIDSAFLDSRVENKAPPVADAGGLGRQITGKQDQDGKR